MQGVTGFYGWRVVVAAFVVAMFGWGLGFYGPPVFLHVVVLRTGWPVGLVSAAVTLHFLCGAAVVAMLPQLYRRFGLPRITLAGSVVLALGLLGWSLALAPWQLFLAALASGIGWVTMGAAAINAIIAPWFSRRRPAALAMAYNGASIGGVVFSPLWVALITRLDFTGAALAICAVMLPVMLWLVCGPLAVTPARLGQLPDGDMPDGDPARNAAPAAAEPPALAGRALWRNRHFLTLAAAMALSLFAQIGLIAHLFSLLVPAFGAQWAGFAAGLATACAIAGRSAVGWLLPVGADRRLAASLSLLVQAAGSLAFILAGGGNVALLLAGVVLFGLGIGNVTSLPPLIAQAEFARQTALRVVALIVALGQAGYAFAPAAFGLLREASTDQTALFFSAALVIQLAAIGCFLLGRQRPPGHARG